MNERTHTCASACIHAAHALQALVTRQSCQLILALSRHRRRHVHCAGMGGEAVILSAGTPIPARMHAHKRSRVGMDGAHALMVRTAPTHTNMPARMHTHTCMHARIARNARYAMQAQRTRTHARHARTHGTVGHAHTHGTARTRARAHTHGTPEAWGAAGRRVLWR